MVRAWALIGRVSDKIARSRPAERNARYVDLVPVVRVLRTRDRRWRLEYLSDGRIDVIYLGHKIMARATEAQVGRRLAEEGVEPGDLVED